MLVKLSYIPWCTTKQSHFVPSYLWSCLTTIEVLNSLTLFHRVSEVFWQLWGTKQSHFVPSCLWSCLTTLEVQKRVSLCPIVFVKLSANPWGTKQSHFVLSCLWSCLTTIEVLNSLTLSHRVCEVLRQPLKYYTVSLCHIVFVKLSDNHWGTNQSHFSHRVCGVVWQHFRY